MTGLNYSVLEVRRPSKEAGTITQAKEDGSLNQDRNSGPSERLRPMSLLKSKAYRVAKEQHQGER